MLRAAGMSPGGTETLSDTSTSTVNTVSMPARSHFVSVFYAAVLPCYSLSFFRHPLEGGLDPVASPPNSSGCPTGKYHHFEQIQLTARPASGWSVRSWIGTMNDASTSLGNLVSMPPYDHQVSVYYRPPCERSFAIPSGGEVWLKGEAHTIQWFWGGCGQIVNIQLIKNGVLYDTIATLPSSTETFTWTPALWYENASNYQIKVVDYSDPSIMTLTPFFTLADPPICYINITSPHGGEAWTKGVAQTISWSSGPACTTLTLKLLRGGSFLNTLTTSASASGGLYSWTPAHNLTATDSYQIQIVENSDSSKTATSNAFSLQDDAPGAADFFTILPCRLVDTRSGARMESGVPRLFAAAGEPTCGIPLSAKAASLNVTVVAPTGAGNIALYPSDQSTPTTSTVNFAAGQNRANNAIIPLGEDGRIAARASIAGSGSADLILDANGYFATSSAPHFGDDFEAADFSPYLVLKIGYFPETVSWGFTEENGSGVLEGTGGYSSGGGDSVAFLANFDQSNVLVSTRLKVQEVRNAGHHSGVVARFNPATLEFYELWVNTVSNQLILNRRTGSSEVRLASTSLPPGLLGSWITLELETSGSNLRGMVNGQLLIDVHDSYFTHGTVGFYNAGGTTRYDDFQVEALDE